MEFKLNMCACVWVCAYLCALSIFPLSLSLSISFALSHYTSLILVYSLCVVTRSFRFSNHFLFYLYTKKQQQHRSNDGRTRKTAFYFQHSMYMRFVSVKFLFVSLFHRIETTFISTVFSLCTACYVFKHSLLLNVLVRIFLLVMVVLSLLLLY